MRFLIRVSSIFTMVSTAILSQTEVVRSLSPAPLLCISPVCSSPQTVNHYATSSFDTENPRENVKNIVMSSFAPSSLGLPLNDTPPSLPSLPELPHEYDSLSSQFDSDTVTFQNSGCEKHKTTKLGLGLVRTLYSISTKTQTQTLLRRLLMLVTVVKKATAFGDMSVSSYNLSRAMSIVVIHFMQVSVPIQKEAGGDDEQDDGSVCVGDGAGCVTQHERLDPKPIRKIPPRTDSLPLENL